MKRSAINTVLNDYFAGDEGDEKTSFTKEEVEAMVSSATTKAVDEAKNKFSSDKGELLSDLKKAKETIKTFDGLDAENVRNMMSAFENNQDLKDIADGKHEEVINRRIEKERSEYTSKINNQNEALEELQKTNSGLTQKVTDLMINSNAISEFIKEQGQESATMDVVNRAKAIFKIEGDDIIARDAKGDIITGAAGPMTMKEFVLDLKKNAPHLYKGSVGSDVDDNGEKGSDIQNKIKAALGAGDQNEYRRLRKLQREGKSA